MFNINLNGKVAAITGASQGIGKAIAEVLAEHGAEVVLLSRSKNKLEANVNEFKAKGYKAKYYILDVSKEENVKEIFKGIGNVDILVNNAGVNLGSSVYETDIKQWRELIDINLNGAMFCSQAALNSMIKNNYGRIINISSVSGKTGYSYSSAYSASKFGLIGFTQSLAQEVIKYKITANTICPGWVETEMAENCFNDDKYASHLGISKEELKTSSLLAVPIERYVYPKEVAHLALYLASDYASAIVGQAINICGGVCMH